MIILLYILLFLILLFLGVILYFFNLAFVRKKGMNPDDLNTEQNAFLKPYAELLKEGMDFVDNTEHKRYETVSFDGLKLSARYYNQNSDRTILLFHGYRSSARHDFSCAVKMYYENGFNILLVDQRSHGSSEGSLITFGVKESRDVVSWVEFLNAKFPVSQIILSGLSMGATTVLLSLKYKMPENVKGVIADCGFDSPVEIIKKVAKQSFKIDATLFIPIMDFFCRLFGKFSIQNVSTAEAVKNTKLPIMLIHGKDDNFVPCEMSQRTYNAAKEHAKIVLVDGADHGISFLVAPKLVLGELNGFFEENLS